jgi:hypothetical protein
VAERREMAEGGKGKSISEFGVICSECPRVAESVREGSRVKLGSEFFINFFRIFDAARRSLFTKIGPKSSKTGLTLTKSSRNAKAWNNYN